MAAKVDEPKVALVPDHRRRLSTRKRLREAAVGYAFFSPWLIGFLVFTAWPVLYSLYLSFTNYDILQPAQWIGLTNYRIALGSSTFWHSMYDTLYYVAFSVPFNLVLGILLAILLNQKVRGQRVFRTIVYLPSILSGVAISLLWLWLLNPNFGLVNLGLATIGIHGPGWLTSQYWTKPAIVLMGVWSVGGTMVIFLAGLQGISQELYDAAYVDGANAWARLRNVTLPMLSPTIFFNLVMGVIGGFQVFTQAYIMTAGGPNNSTLFYAFYLFQQAFENFQMGFGSALAWILFVIVMALTLVILRTSYRWVFYEAGDLLRNK